MGEYPTQEYVKGLMDAGKWPAKEGEVLDIRSLSDKEIKVLEMYNQEEIIKQLRLLNEKLAPVKTGKAKKPKSVQGDPVKPIDNSGGGDEPPDDSGSTEKQ